MTLPTPFPVARYRIEADVETPLHLPEYAGSTLRGAFGRALRRTACMTREKDCKTCPLYRSCPYPAIFEPPPPVDHALQKFTQIPTPFIIEPPPWGERHYATGETLVFHLVVIGRAHAQLPIIIHALQQAMQRGIGKGDGQARLTRVVLIDGDHETMVFSAETGQLQPHPIGIQVATDNTPGPGTRMRIGLRIHTPLRLQHNSQPIRPAQLTARDLLVALLRRVALLSEFHVGQRLDLDYTALAAQAATVTTEGRLDWRDWTRYSSRQQQEMILGGCVGHWTLQGELTDYLPFLRLGQWLHCGKNASFGLGRYTLTDTEYPA
jgi:hypothetical protein